MAALADAPEPAKPELRTVQPEHLSSSQRALARQMSSVTAQPMRLPDLWAEQRSGILSRLAPDGGISVFIWCRPAAAPDMIFGAQLALGELGGLLTQVLRRESEESEEFCLALLDHAGNPVGKTLNGFAARWSAPYVSTEIGRALPRWEAAAFLLDPSAAGRAARSGRWRLGLLVVAVLAAALAGGALLWRDARRRALDARQKADFVSNVSHELRTPLTSIRMFSDLLANPDASPTPDKTRKYAEVISREASRLTRLINTVLDFSRFERGKAQLHCEELDLRTLTEELLDNYRPQIESAGFELRCELPADPLLVKGDRDRLAQVLLNLLSNAEKYGGGQRKEIAVTLHTDLQRNAAVLTVADRGPGVPKGKERRIFEKFFRAEDALASGVQGSGLGLTLARQIAQAHGGDVTCTRRDGGGSLFSVCIPLTSESHSPMPT
jgi:signal transduction histidine kinase